MSELERRAQAAGRLLAPPIEAADTERALARFYALRERQQKRRVIAASAAGGAAMVAAALIVALQPGAPGGRTGPGDERTIHFADGSVAVLLEEGTVLRVEESSEALLEIGLQKGRARFDVAPNPARLFRVVTAGLRVEVLGTSFTVGAENRGLVEVHRGRVAVFAGENRHELVAGMSFRLDGERSVVAPAEPAQATTAPPEAAPVEEETAERATLEEEPATPAPKRRRGVRRAASAVPAGKWRHLAEKGLFSEAYQALEDDAAERRIGDLPGLLLAADAARLSGHPAEAAAYLEQALAEHPHEAQASLAAFTLGRIYERELARPIQAAEAFARARALGPSGSLAEDALAHEIECWLRAGRKEQAKARAQLYLAEHPEGRRVERLRGLAEER